MPDDPANETESGGFDDWLSEAPAKATDPYAELSEEDADEDAGDWQSFADGADSDDDAAVGSEPEEQVSDDESTAEPEPEDDAPTEPESSGDLISDGAGDDQSADGGTDGDDTGEVPSVGDEDEPDDDDDQDDTGEIPIVEILDDERDDPESDPVSDQLGSEPVVEFEAFDGDDEPDTGELEIVVPAAFGEIDSGAPDATLMYDGGFEADSADPLEASSDESDASSESFAADDADGDGSPESAMSDVPIVAWVPETTDEEISRPDDFDPLEDTGEAVFVSGESSVGEVAAIGAAAAGFGDLWDQDSAGDNAPGDASTGGSEDGTSSTSEDMEEFTLGEDDLLLGATQEHIGLAAAIAAAENEDTEQVALVAEIPGLETPVVGFEDVVEAEGHRRVRARPSGDLIARIITGVILVLALGASLIWLPALVVFAVAVFVLGAGEFYTALVRTGRKPIALFGFIGIVGASAGAFFWSAVAIPIAFVLATILLLLFYAVMPGKPDPMGNLALTTTVMVWAGLGSFAMLIARSDDYQVLILGVVVAVAAADIAAFFVGRSLGRTHFAPWVSPKKTVEGLVAGGVVALGVGAMLHFFPPFELTSGLAIGAAAALLTPVGDLAMSAAKRALGLKDMGSVLPGHGGFLDRIDGLLFVIPVAWAVFVWAGLL